MTRKILRLDEIEAMTGVPKNTLRYWRAQSPERGPNLFLLGKRLVAFEDEVLTWVEAQHAATSSNPLAKVAS